MLLNLRFLCHQIVIKTYFIYYKINLLECHQIAIANHTYDNLYTLDTYLSFCLVFFLIKKYRF